MLKHLTLMIYHETNVTKCNVANFLNVNRNTGDKNMCTMVDFPACASAETLMPVLN